MNEIFRKMWYCFLCVAVGISLSLVARWSIPLQKDLDAKKAECDALQAEVKTVQNQITQIKSDIDRFNSSPHFVERLARMNHRVADNEIVFIFQ